MAKGENGKTPFLKLAIFVVVVVLCTFTPTGYQFTIVNVPAPILQKFINQTALDHYGVSFSKETMAVMWSLTVACQGIGAVVGSLISKIPVEMLGRKWSVLGLLSASYIIGSVLLMISKVCNAFEVIMVGRFIVGIGSGFTFSIVSVYLLECTPASYRAMVGSLGFLGVLIGDALARVIGTVATEDNWQYCLGATIVPAVILLLLSPIFPESPKYLLLQRKDTAAAAKSIGFYFGESRVQKREAKIRNEEQKSIGVEQVGLIGVFKQKVYRIPFLVSVVANAAAAAGGLFACFSYSSTIFTGLGLEKGLIQILTFVMIAANLVSGVAQIFLVVKVRRRVLMLGALVVIVTAHIVYLACAIGVRYSDVKWPAYISAAALIIVLIAIDLGIASTSIFLPAEISTVASRAITATSASVVRCAGIMITQFAFNPMYNALGDFTFCFFIFFSILCLLYLWKELPETKGRTLDEIAAKWREPEAHDV